MPPPVTVPSITWIKNPPSEITDDFECTDVDLNVILITYKQMMEDFAHKHPEYKVEEFMFCSHKGPVPGENGLQQSTRVAQGSFLQRYVDRMSRQVVRNRSRPPP